MEKIEKGTPVSVALRDGQVVFGKYDKEGRNGYHWINLENGNRIDRKMDKIKIVNASDVSFKHTNPVSNERLPSLTPPKTFSINEKFMFLENMIRMVIKKTAVSMIITGEGGVRKNTYR